MAAQSGVKSETRFFFTSPWEPIVVRRGDALGLRALADQFADAVAPDLSNRIRDGRWVTILAWCLARSHSAFHASGRKSIETRAEQVERYAWLRPLELMWISRTIAIAEKTWRQRSLSGQRRVQPWYRRYVEQRGKAGNRFGMSLDQFRAYRQTGMYGGYRLAFRKWPGMTVRGDGWTPGPATNCLAKWLDDRLGKAARPSWPLHVGDGDEDGLSSRSAKRRRGDEHQWWLQNWQTFYEGGRRADDSTLPRLKADFSKLPEADLLQPLAFGGDRSGTRRLEVAREIAKVAGSDHSMICEHLGRVFANNRTISLLPRFSRLADAGMAAMDLLATSLGNKPRVSLADAAGGSEAAAVCEDLIVAAQEWRTTAAMEIRHIEMANRFSNAISSTSPKECLRDLLQHHEVYGGGLRWFVLRNGWIEPRTPPRIGSARYRFRLWSLCRLAAQCGVTPTMPAALRGDFEEQEDESSEVADE